MSTAFEDLAKYLHARPSGPVANERELVRLLAAAWEDLDGSYEQSTTADKLGRIEAPTWDPPVLRFDLERHGATVNGSTRAAVHEWQVDTEARTATIVLERPRQLSQTAARVDVEAIAADLVDKIVDRADDPRLVWNRDRSDVRVKLGDSLPAGAFKQTMAGRTKRLRLALVAELTTRGWYPTAVRNHFASA
jgi:hypothetical protein